MLKTRTILAVLLVAMAACHSSDPEKQARLGIAQAEADFARMAAEKGIQEAFTFFAADSAVLMRNNTLIKGKQAIAQAYQNVPATTRLSWTADTVIVAKSGDLGYTYGRYSISGEDSLGNPQTNEGIFHTVWQRQQDGSWKFVWD